MNIRTQTINKIGQIPEALVLELNDHIDFLLWRNRHNQSGIISAVIIQIDRVELVNCDRIKPQNSIKY
jgi:hypothetical protein